MLVGLLLRGERGIRTPGPVKDNGFQDRRIKPLCHLSEAAKVQFFLFYEMFGFLFRENIFLPNILRFSQPCFSLNMS